MLIVGSLLLAAALGVLALRDTSTPRWGFFAIAALEALLVVIAIWCVVAWIGGNAPDEPVVFAFYLLACLAIPPAMAWWGKGEPGRWGSGVVAVACLVLIVLVLRVQQVWSGGVPPT